MLSTIAILHSLIGIMAAQDAGTCVGIVRPCLSLFSTTQCTYLGGLVDICTLFLDSCQVACEGLSAACFCQYEGLGCEGEFPVRFCHGRLSCGGSPPACSSLTTRDDCNGIWDCDWNPAPDRNQDEADQEELDHEEPDQEERDHEVPDEMEGGGRCGICLRLIGSDECPADPSLSARQCTPDEVTLGQLCKADDVDDECGTDSSVTNCGNDGEERAVYERIPCDASSDCLRLLPNFITSPCILLSIAMLCLAQYW